MKVKYGQVYVGKKSGDHRRVVGTTETEGVYLLQNCHEPDYISEWTQEEIERCCYLKEEEKWLKKQFQ